MTSSEALEKMLPAFESYYTVTRGEHAAPFDATAEFHSHTETYVLVKSAKTADIDSNEFVYFSLCRVLDETVLKELSFAAWNAGLKKVQPCSGHRNSDVTLIVLADSFSGDLRKCAKRLRYSKNYRCGLYGWSNFRLAALGLEHNSAVSNWHGRDLKKLFFKTGLLSAKMT